MLNFKPIQNKYFIIFIDLVVEEPDFLAARAKEYIFRNFLISKELILHILHIDFTLQFNKYRCL